MHSIDNCDVPVLIPHREQLAACLRLRAIPHMGSQQ